MSQAKQDKNSQGEAERSPRPAPESDCRHRDVERVQRCPKCLRDKADIDFETGREECHFELHEIDDEYAAIGLGPEAGERRAIQRAIKRLFDCDNFVSHDGNNAREEKINE